MYFQFSVFFETCEGQTHKQTYVLIAILRPRTGGKVCDLWKWDSKDDDDDDGAERTKTG